MSDPTFAYDFRIPVQGPVTQLYGVNAQRYAKFGMPAGHPSIDIACEVGSPVRNMAGAGKVIFAGYYSDALGISVFVCHEAEGIVTKYSHLDSVAVKRGDEVQPGHILGWSGNTGISDGPHLDFGFAEIRMGMLVPTIADLINLDNRDNGCKGWLNPLPYIHPQPKVLDSAWADLDQGAPHARGVEHVTDGESMFANQAQKSTQGLDNAALAAGVANSAGPVAGESKARKVAQGAKYDLQSMIRKLLLLALPFLGIEMADGEADLLAGIFARVTGRYVREAHPETAAQLDDALARIDELEARGPQTVTVYRDAPESAPAATPEPQPATAGDLCLTVLPPSDGSYWRVRTRPGIERDNWDGGYVLPGDSVCLVDSVPVQAGGHLWQEIRLRDGTTGWVSGEALMAPVRERGTP